MNSVFTPTSPVSVGESGFRVQTAGCGDGRVRVRVFGELDLATVGELSSVLGREVAAGGQVVLDLSQVHFIDSTGLHAILVSVDSAQADGGRVTVSSRLSAQAMRLFELTGMLQALTLVDD